jgi:TonB-dependent receptor
MPYTSTAVPPVNLSQVTTGSPVFYYDGLRYQNGYNISLDSMRNLFANGSGAGFATSAAGNLFAAGAIQQDNKEDVYAAYAQEQLTFGKLELLAGLRFELTRATYTGNDSVPTSGGPTERGGQTLTFNGSTLVPVSSSNNYSNVFPTLQARYELQPDLIARATYSSAIGRPGFNQANPAATIDAANNIVTMGNPGLKPITSNNLDLSIERYFQQGGIASLGVFDKELSNYIFGRTQYGGITNPVILSGLGSQATLTQVVTYANIPKSRAWGVEVNYAQKFTFLPGWLSGFGTNLNYTYVQARGDIRPGESAQLPSTSQDNYNAELYWEYDRFAVRGALSYVGRSLLFVGNTAALDQFTESRLAADASASYAIDKHFSIYVAGRNLLNTAHTITEGASNRVIQRETFGRAVFIGFTGNL